MSASVPSADARYLAFSDAHLHLMVGEAEEVAEGKQEYQQRVYFNDKNPLLPYMPRPVQYSGSDKTESRHWNHKVYKGRECGACQKRSLCTKAKARELLIDIREPLLQKMREKLISEEGRRKYFMRQYIIEPVFGHLKFNVGYRNFLLRGLEKVCAEFKLMCIGWNLKKMLKLGIKPATI